MMKWDKGVRFPLPWWEVFPHYLIPLPLVGRLGGGRKRGSLKKSLTMYARKLRQELTEAEKYLWLELRCRIRNVKFRRQAVIGQYIVDFVCFEKKLVIEVDGGQHNQNNDDKKRDEWLNSQGFQVLRFWNNDVLGNRGGVLEMIVKQIQSPSLALPIKGEGKGSVGIPLPSPPHKGGGK